MRVASSLALGVVVSVLVNVPSPASAIVTDFEGRPAALTVEVGVFDQTDEADMEGGIGFMPHVPATNRFQRPPSSNRLGRKEDHWVGTDRRLAEFRIQSGERMSPISYNGGNNQVLCWGQPEILDPYNAGYARTVWERGNSLLILGSCRADIGPQLVPRSLLRVSDSLAGVPPHQRGEGPESGSSYEEPERESAYGVAERPLPEGFGWMLLLAAGIGVGLSGVFAGAAILLDRCRQRRRTGHDNR